MLVRHHDNQRAYPYESPVVVLVNANAFSAADIFVGALAGRPRVTLMGTATGGGSGRSTQHRLARSGLAVRLSTMASFRPNGALYDGHGVEPDVVIHPTLDDYTVGTDSVLDAAIARLRR